MDEQAKDQIVPPNEIGKKVDLHFSETGNSIEKAISIFKKARERLLNPAHWNEVAVVAMATIKVACETEGDLERPVKVNDYLMIDIAGPGPAAGEGYDWVKVESIEENVDPAADESIGMKLRATANPHKKEEGIAHFFQESATSSFMITRKGATVNAAYYGRNEVPNSKAVKLTDKIRNTLIASAAFAGISELQWSALLKGFLKK